jgi:hypothetical protein
MIVPIGTNLIRPINFSSKPGNTDHRLGGRAPVSLVPIDTTNRYLLTIGVEEGLFLSIFLRDDQSYFISNALSVIDEREGSIDVIFHAPLGRRKDDLFASTYSGHALVLGPLQEDEYREGEEIQTPDSGNRAWLMEDEKAWHDVVNTIEERGFQHFLQLDGSSIGSREVPVNGSDAFGTGIMHLYLKKNNSQYKWCCFFDS